MLVLFLLSSSLYAQTSLTPGWVIRLSGDTVRGDIVRTSFTDYSERVCLEVAKVRRCFAPNEARAFYAKADGLFESHSVSWFQNDSPGRSVQYHRAAFSHKLVSGPLSLYELDRFGRQFYYAKTAGTDTLTYLPYYFELVDDSLRLTGYRLMTLDGIAYEVEETAKGKAYLRTDRGYYLPNRSFQNVLRRLMQDCPQITIGPRTEYRDEVLSTLVRNYNGCRGYTRENNPPTRQTRSITLMGGLWELGPSWSVLLDFGYKRNPKLHPELLWQRYLYEEVPARSPAYFQTITPRVRYEVLTFGAVSGQFIGGLEWAIKAPTSLYGRSIIKAHLGAGVSVRLYRFLYWHAETSIPLFPQFRTGLQLRG